jgi:hypothetical protein
MINDERITNIHLLSDNTSPKHLTLFLAPAWYDREKRNRGENYPLPQDNHYFKMININSESLAINKRDNNIPFLEIKSWAYTHCVPLGFYKNNVLFVDSDVTGISMWRGRAGFNPVDAFKVSCVPLDENLNKDYVEYISKYRSINTLYGYPTGIKGIFSATPTGKIFALMGIYDEVTEEGYCIALSTAQIEFDGKNYLPSASMWISSFSPPEFNVSEIKSKSETVIIKSPITNESIPQEVWTGDVKKDRFTHIATSFFGSIPLLAYRNERDKSIRVMDYDPQLTLTGSPSRQVILPQEFQNREVNSLLMTANKEIACLGVVFSGKKTEESKTLFLFCRTKESTDWKEYNQFELPNDSLSPTMCIQDNNLFYAYLQPIAADKAVDKGIDNPSEITDKQDKISTDKKVVIFKHSLTNSKKP